MSYEDIIARKSAATVFPGIEPSEIRPHLYPHQRDLARWALRRGRAALFADTGLGKGPTLLEWARQVAEHGRVLILAPIAVGQQLEREARKFGTDGVYRRSDEGDRVTIANYEMLHAFDPSRFVGVVLDESSILKAFDGTTRKALTSAFASTPFRLCCTATPAPNDFTELGTHAEFLGVKTRAEMLAEFFVHDGGSTQDWRIKGHAVAPFWRWVATWGAVVKRPSDLGHSDDGFALPPLHMHEHIVPTDEADVRAAGRLFADDAMTLAEQRAVKRATIDKRVAKVVEVAGRVDGPVMIWCDLNAEHDALEEAFGERSFSVRGNDSIEAKEDAIRAWLDGERPVMISKVACMGFGLNLQHCADTIFANPSHSYEGTYQAIRRFWRFGQRRPVNVHVVRTDADGQIVANYRRKEADADRMAMEMTAHVGAAVRAEVTGTVREWNPYNPSRDLIVPSWLISEAA